jgi:hypothetical protein
MKQMVIFTDLREQVLRLGWNEWYHWLKGAIRKKKQSKFSKFQKTCDSKGHAFAPLRTTNYYWVEQNRKEQKFLDILNWQPF